MAITILDYVKAAVGDKDSYAVEDFYRNGVSMTGGCQLCAASLAAYNAYPSRSGYWRCADCIGESGFATVAEFKMLMFEVFCCPACGSIDTISENRVTKGERAEGYALECGDCGAVWQL